MPLWMVFYLIGGAGFVSLALGFWRDRPQWVKSTAALVAAALWLTGLVLYPRSEAGPAYDECGVGRLSYDC